jgi:hypothetical protein
MSRRPLLFCRGAILLAACGAASAFNSPCWRIANTASDAAPASRSKEQATGPGLLLWIKSAGLTPRARAQIQLVACF